jgi:magnesium transporter
MITAYVRFEDRLQGLPLEPGMPIPPSTVWLDVLRPGDSEREQISAQLRVDLPTREDMSEIEASSRMYMEGDAAFLTTPVIARGGAGQPDLGLLSFVLTPTVLVTVRFTEPLWFSTFAARALRRPGLVQSPTDALIGLLEAVVDRAADVLEMIGSRLDRLSNQVFAEAVREPPPEPILPPEGGQPRRRRLQLQRPTPAPLKPRDDQLRAAITGVGWAGDLTHKVRDCLVGLERLCAFLNAVVPMRLDKEQKVRLKTISRDIRGLVDHSGFQALQTNFLLDATLGVIDLQQTNIIKIFSVAAVAFLPPTLVASIYGMNFKHMPELPEVWGYPLALLLMLASAVLPLMYFRRKGWL